jgi:hypothetical protein
MDRRPSRQDKTCHTASLNDQNDVQLYQFDLELEASAALIELEKAHPEDDIVLVGAETIAEVTSAFRNYFKDVGAFLKFIKKGKAELAAS